MALPPTALLATANARCKTLPVPAMRPLGLFLMRGGHETHGSAGGGRGQFQKNIAFAVVGATFISINVFRAPPLSAPLSATVLMSTCREIGSAHATMVSAHRPGIFSCWSAVTVVFCVPARHTMISHLSCRETSSRLSLVLGPRQAF